MLKKLCLLMIFIFLLTLGCAKTSTNDITFLRIVTGPTSGTYYPLGGALSDILNKNGKKLNVSVQSSTASVANVNHLRDGNADIAFVQNDIAYYAYHGIEMFKDNKVDNIRGLVTLYPEAVQIVTSKHSGILSLSDLKGKRVAVGAIGSGTVANATQVLNEVGMSFSDIIPCYLSINEASSALRDGNIDAAFMVSGFPIIALQQMVNYDLKFISLDDDFINKMTKKYPFYTKIVIPAGTYKDVDYDINAISVKSMLVVNKSISDDVAFDIVSLLYKHIDRMRMAHRIASYIKKDTAIDGMSIPIHNGVKKYFKL